MCHVQIVLMEGGTNDFHAGVDLPTQEDWANQYISFIREVRHMLVSGNASAPGITGNHACIA